MDKADVRSIVKAIEDLTREVKAGNEIALREANRIEGIGSKGVPE